jgi:tetratricopeptide (TPR) repeat protein
MGHTFLTSFKKYHEAVECFDKAIAIDPGFADAWCKKGYVHLKFFGEYAKAVSCFERSIAISPKIADAWRDKGYALNMMFRNKEAIECFDRAIEIEHNDADAWNSKGVTLFDIGRFDDAIECFDEALRIDPNFVYARRNRKFALRNIGKQETMPIGLYDLEERNSRFKLLNAIFRIIGLINRWVSSHLKDKLKNSELKDKYNEFRHMELKSSVSPVHLIYTTMPLKFPLQSFIMPLKYHSRSGRMPVKFVSMPAKYTIYHNLYQA